MLLTAPVYLLQFMDLIKNLLESQTLYRQFWLKKSEYRRVWDESAFIYPKQFSKLHQEKYVPCSRRRISQIQTSAIQPSLAKKFAEIRRKVLAALSWFGVVTKMAYKQGETDVRDICCRELFTAIRTVLEQNRGTFV